MAPDPLWKIPIALFFKAPLIVLHCQLKKSEKQAGEGVKWLCLTIMEFFIRSQIKNRYMMFPVVWKMFINFDSEKICLFFC